MARFTMYGYIPLATREEPFQYCWDDRLTYFDTYITTQSYGYDYAYDSVCIPDLHIKSVIDFNFTVRGHPHTIHGYVLQAGEESKLPDILPPGVKLYDPAPSREGQGACKMLSLDWAYYLDLVEQANLRMALVPTDDVDDLVNNMWCNLWGWSVYWLHHQIQCAFDFSSQQDRCTTFDVESMQYYFSAYDSAMPHLNAKRVDYTDRLSHPDGGGLGELEHHWNSMSDYVYEIALDDNFKGAAIARFHNAFGARLEQKTAAVHTQKGRKIELDTDIPFPPECRLDLWSNTFLVFRIDRQGRYRKASMDGRWVDDIVFIHRVGSRTRFIFLERRTMAREVADRTKFVAIYPVNVPDNECVRKMPVSPMRGMDPRVTAAIASTPYLASAFQHALNRRKYLQSKLPPEPYVVYNIPDAPILIRADNDDCLRPSRHSRIGRAAVQHRRYRYLHQIGVFISDLGNNEIRFADPLQPVALAPVARRPLVLDI